MHAMKLADLKDLSPEQRAQLDTYARDPAIVAMMLVGSSTKAYGDALSDYDVEMVVDDAAVARFSGADILRYLDGDVRKLEFYAIARSDFLAKKTSVSDIDHWYYPDAVVLHDPHGFLATELPLITAMPKGLQIARLKLHFFELLYSVDRIQGLLARGNELNTRLVAAQAVASALRVAFVAAGRYPPIIHWSSQNLGEVAAAAGLEPPMLELLRTPAVKPAMALKAKICDMLRAQGHEFSMTHMALTFEVVSPAFRRIRETYGCL